MAKTRRQKYPYIVPADRIIYMVRTPGCDDFFIWHCKKDLMKATFKRHLQGQRKATADLVRYCSERGYHPCFHLLEEIHTTQVMAYRHVIAWSELFYRRGYEPLVDDTTLFYMSELHEYTQNVFDRIENADPKQLLSCENCLVKSFAEYCCPAGE